MALHLGQVVGSVVYTSFLLERLVLPPFQRYGLGKMTWRHLVVHVFGCVMPGMLCYLCAFFALLHAWMNAFAEMTRFADRMFYRVRVSRSHAGCSLRRRCENACPHHPPPEVRTPENGKT